MIQIIGAGLAGCIIASRYKDAIIYERDRIGGLCRDNKHYQEYVHIVHTDNQEVYDFFKANTTVRDYRIEFLSYVDGQYKDWYPREITPEVIDKQIKGYSKKMWQGEIPPEAEIRLRTSPDKYFFHNKFEFIPDFTLLFKNLLKNADIYFERIKDGDIDGKIILTGPIDEYFDYVYGKLPYRGIQATHIETEIRLQADCINIPDETIPFTRLVDYHRLGFEGNWIGIETPSKDDHYPIRNSESEQVFEKYRQLAEKKGIILLGRQATFHYMDVDQVVEQALNIEI